MAGYKKDAPNRFSEVHGCTLQIVFDSPDMLLAFKSWLCDGGGEQSFNDMDGCEYVGFDYWSDGHRIDARSESGDELKDGETK